MTLPDILGADIAGEIAEVGEYIAGFKPGQRVLLAPMHFCITAPGASPDFRTICAEFTVLAPGRRIVELIAVPAVNIIPIADSLDFTGRQPAAGFHHRMARWWGGPDLRSGQTVLVPGASSGMGIAAIQIAKLFNARVITTAGDETKLEKARELGADHGINHYQQKISEEVRKITNKEGVDIVIEHVGSATWDESVKCLKPAGTLVTCGATTGFAASIDLRFLFSRQLSLLGSYMGTVAELREVLGHVFSGRLKPVVDRVFPLQEIRAAHEYLEKSRMFGKVVIECSH